MREKLIAAVAAAMVFAAFGLVPSQASAHSGVNGWRMSNSTRTASNLVERLRLVYWAQIHALRAFERKP